MTGRVWGGTVGIGRMGCSSAAVVRVEEEGEEEGGDQDDDGIGFSISTY